ncbi:MAG: 7-cyano-7-deazaguanine synthase QueC [Planctomycetes bacterium]|nr:7-cyano-7-deazaguanine synthase QueC [Planctomycetota bacterium]
MGPTSSALILLSGGLDSAVTALAARHLGYRLHGLTFAYGQRQRAEIEYAQALAAELGFLSYRVIDLPPFPPRSSALTDADLPVPRQRTEREMQEGSIPATYVPARNTLFLAYALAWCEGLEAGSIFLGVNALDYSGYPDCRPEYLQAFRRLADLATKRGVEGRRIRLHAPLLHRTKAEIIRLGAELGIDFRKTWSCYDPVREGCRWLACGACDSCSLRRKGFLEAGIEDPTPYAAK